MDLGDLDAISASDLIGTRAVSSRELVMAAIERIEERNPAVNAVIHKLYDAAIAAAEDPKLAETPLRGVPTLIKDLDGSSAGDPWYGGSLYLKKLGWREPDDSHAIAQMRRAGLIIVGKTATPEFGMQLNTVSDVHGVTRNPWNLDHSAGGSSGGSGAAVAARMVPVAHAGDGGGSIRVPSAFNGLFGLKPSRGRVSNAPLEADAWGGLVCRHVLTRSVRDSALLLDHVSRPGPGDPYVAPAAAGPYRDEVCGGVRGLRVGILRHSPLGGPVDPECTDAVARAGRLLEEAGAAVEESHPGAYQAFQGEDFVKIVMSWVGYEIEDLIRRSGVEPEEGDLSPPVLSALEVARSLPATRYVAAMEAIHAWSRRMKAWWQDFDILLAPVSPWVAPVLGSARAQPVEPPDALNALAFTAPFNATGQPAASIPMGWTPAGLPVAVQAVAALGREDLLFRVAGSIERLAPWAHRKPALAMGHAMGGAMGRAMARGANGSVSSAV
ncbi:Indoleacetamide hydrolase [Methylorubrum populi]